MRYCPVPSLTTVRVFSISTGLDASTLTPGSTAADASRMTPVIVACANARLGSSRIPATAAMTFTTRCMTNLLESIGLEPVLDRELHDAWRAGRCDLAERREVVQSGRRLSPLEPIERVEGIDANLDILRAQYPYHPRQGAIEAARSHPSDAVAHAGAERASTRLGKRRGVQKPHTAVRRIDRHVRIRIVEHLIRALRAHLSVQRDVASSGHRQPRPGGFAEAAHQPPIRERGTQRLIVQPRRLDAGGD